MAGVLQEADKAKKQEEKAKKEAEKGPKRGLSAYMYYTADVRAKFKEENPDAKLGDLAKLMGAKWKTLSAEDKAPYEEKAKEETARYEEEKITWLAANGVDIKEIEDDIEGKLLDIFAKAEGCALYDAEPWFIDGRLGNFGRKVQAELYKTESWFIDALAQARQIAHSEVTSGVEDLFHELLIHDEGDMQDTELIRELFQTDVEEAFSLVDAVCADIVTRRDMTAQQFAAHKKRAQTISQTPVGVQGEATPAGPGSVPSTPLREPGDAAPEESTSTFSFAGSADAPTFSAGAAEPGKGRRKGQAGRQRGRRKR